MTTTTTTTEISTWHSLLNAAQAANLQPNNRFAQLATLQISQEIRPAVRTVAVRGLLDDGRILISSDTRNDTVAELLANPACELCWYFTETQEQFRFSGRVHVITAAQANLDVKWSAVMQAVWENRSEASRQSASWPAPKRHLEAATAFIKPTPHNPPESFALLLLEVLAVDYLNLLAPQTKAHPAHQRIIFNKLGLHWLPRAVNP